DDRAAPWGHDTPDGNRHVPVHRHRGLDPARPGPRRSIRESPRRPLPDAARRDRTRRRHRARDRGRQLLRGLPERRRRRGGQRRRPARARRARLARRRRGARPDGPPHGRGDPRRRQLHRSRRPSGCADCERSPRRSGGPVGRHAIAGAIGVREAANRPLAETLKESIHDRELLLVLDNFEQILGAASRITDLLTGAPRLRVLVTSRAVLHVHGEHELPVPPLRIPDPAHLPRLEALSQFEGVALFLERAMAARPDFAVTPQSAPAIAEIVARLDGLPLAIELAAAKAKLLGAEAILGRLGSRLAFLGGGARDLPARQQTLRQAIDWSYGLLT